jgi:hypothetical protein
MEPEDWLSNSQEQTTEFYSYKTNLVHNLTTYSFRCILILSSNYA